MTTHVLMVTDESGSMAPVAADVRGGFNQMLDDLAEKDGSHRLTVTFFSDKIDYLCSDVDISDVPRLTRNTYKPGGMTALLAAIGKTVEAFEKANPDLPADDKVLLVIQTDGHENWSFAIDEGKYAWDVVSKMLVEREQRGWAILYMGATADAWHQGAKLGLQGSSILRTEHDSAGYASSYAAVTGATQVISRGGDAEAAVQTATRVLNTTA